MDTKKWKQDLKKHVEEKVDAAASTSDTAIAANI